MATVINARRARIAALTNLRLRLAQRGFGMNYVRQGSLAYSFWFVMIAAAIVISLTGVQIETALNIENILTIVTFGMIGVVGFIGMYTTTFQRPFTLASSHWVFVTFFFFYAPLVQFLSHKPPVQDDVGAFFQNTLLTNGVILGWCFIFWLSYRFTFNKKQRVRVAPKPYLPPQNPDYAIVLGLVLFATLVAVLVYGLTGLTSRFQVGQAAQQLNNSAVQGIIGHFCRGVTIISLILLLVNKTKRDIKYYAMVCIVAGCTFLTDDPVSVARFWAGTLVLGIIGTLIRHKRCSGIWLPVTLILGLIFVMPVLNLARRTPFSQINWASYEPSDIASTLDFGDFDAYQMLSDTLYLPDDQISIGNQAAGNLLYFVPRAWWPNKANGSGAYVATYYELGFTNLCEPLPAEGYLNFGFPGVVLWALAFGWVLAKFDRYYWETINRPDAVPPKLLQLVYPFYTGLVLYMMRGDFSASFEDGSGFLLAAWGVMLLAYPSIMRRRNNRFYAKSVDTTTMIPAVVDRSTKS